MEDITLEEILNTMLTEGERRAVYYYILNGKSLPGYEYLVERKEEKCS